MCLINSMIIVKSTEDTIREGTRTKDDNKSYVFYGQGPPSGESLPQNVGSIINYF